MDNIRELKVLVKYLPDQNSLRALTAINSKITQSLSSSIQKALTNINIVDQKKMNSIGVGMGTILATSIGSSAIKLGKALQTSLKDGGNSISSQIKEAMSKAKTYEGLANDARKASKEKFDATKFQKDREKYYYKMYEGSREQAISDARIDTAQATAEHEERIVKARKDAARYAVEGNRQKKLAVKLTEEELANTKRLKAEQEKIAKQQKEMNIRQKMSSSAKYGFLAINAFALRTATQGLEQYRTMADGATRVNAYFTNAVLYNNRKLSRDQAMKIAEKQVVSYQARLQDLAGKSLTPIHELNQAFGQLASFQITGDMMDSKFMESVSDYFAGARAAGKDVNILTDMNRLGKAIQLGHDTLSRYGITMTDNQKKMLKTLPVQKRVALMTQILKQNTEGFVDELKKTDLGRMIIAQNKYKLAIAKTGQIYARMKTSLLEIGTASLPATNGLLRMYEAILGVVSGITQFISSKIPEKLQNFLGAFGGLTLGIIALSQAWKVMSKLLISWKFVAIAAAIALVAIALEDVYRYFKDPSANTFTKKIVEWYKALSPIGKTLVWIAGAFAGIIASLLVFNKVSALISGVTTVFSALSGVFGVLSIKAILIGGAIALIAGAVYYVNKVVQEKFGGWINMFGEIYEWLSQFSAFNFIVDNLKAVYEIITKMLNGDFTGAFQVFADRITEIFAVIPEKISGAWNWVKNKFSDTIKDVNVDYSGVNFMSNSKSDSGYLNSTADRFSLKGNGKVTTNTITLQPSFNIDGSKDPSETARIVRSELDKFMEDNSVILGY